jgi:hypothetical protein
MENVCSGFCALFIWWNNRWEVGVVLLFKRSPSLVRETRAIRVTRYEFCDRHSSGGHSLSSSLSRPSGLSKSDFISVKCVPWWRFTSVVRSFPFHYCPMYLLPFKMGSETIIEFGTVDNSGLSRGFVQVSASKSKSGYTSGYQFDTLKSPSQSFGPSTTIYKPIKYSRSCVAFFLVRVPRCHTFTPQPPLQDRPYPIG